MAGPNSPIGVFDSGVGGISVLRALVKQLPEEHFVYFGDNLRAPYGTKRVEEVRELTGLHVGAMVESGMKAVVVACNTATAAAISQLRARWPEAILVGIEPALKLAVDHFPRGRIGVMGTEMTLREEKFHHLMDQYSREHTITALPCSGLVELIEQGLQDGPEVQAFLVRRLGEYVGKLDCIVLGCTHFPFVSGAISRLMGPDVALLDGSEGTARETKRRLEAAGLLRSEGPGKVELRSSSPESRVLELAQHLLEQE